jgi:hypothetical protein
MIATAIMTATVALALLADAPGESPAPEAIRVALVAPRASRLGQQLRRELQASGFDVQPLAAATTVALTAADVSRAVVVDPGGDRVRVLVRSGDQLIVSDERSVSGRDDLASRRVALAVVEHLRRRPAIPPPAPPPAPVVAAPVTAAVLAPLPPDPAIEARRRPWSLAVATSVDVDGGMGDSLGHVQLVGETTLGELLLGSVRVHWPLFGVRLLEPDARLWTAAAAGGLRLRLPGWGRLQPLLGATAGMRFVIADPRQGKSTLTPALAAGGFAGARYEMRPLVHVALEVGCDWSRPLGDPFPIFVRDAASSRATRVALGVVFEY